MTRSRHDADELNALIGRLLNDDLDTDGRKRLNDLLAGDVAAQRWYVQCLELEAALRMHAESQDPRFGAAFIVELPVA